MRKVIIQVESLAQGFERFQQAWETGAPQGELITFEDVETLLKTLTSKRWELVSVLQKQRPMSIRARAGTWVRREERPYGCAGAQGNRPGDGPSCRHLRSLRRD